MPTPFASKIPTDSPHMFAQVCATANHYSALRYSVFTLFAAITAGLFAAEFALGSTSPQDCLAFLVRVAGIVFTLTFWSAHLRISKLVGVYQAQAYELGLRKPDGHDFWAEFVPLQFSLCFILILAAWVAVCCSQAAV